MSMPPAPCGTDGGYFRHRRVTKTEACGPCKTAHSAATRADRKNRKQRGVPASRGSMPWATCACGQRMASTSAACWRCNKEVAKDLKRGKDYYDPDDDPKRPVTWIRRGLILHPVYEQQSEVA